MSLTAPDGIHVFVDGEDVTDKVIVGPVHGPPSGAASLSFDIVAPTDMTVVNGDTISFSWTETDGPSTVVVEPTTPLSGTWRITRGGSIRISPEDWTIIDDFIIDSVAAGHARRL